MGLGNKQNTLTYVKLNKEGKFQVGKDDNQTYTELEGKLVDLKIVDEDYQGAPIRKLAITLQDGVDKYRLAVGFESSYMSSFINFIKNANLSDAITLVPRVSKDIKDGKEVERRALLVSQDGTFLKSFYSKDTGRSVPQMKEITVNKKKVWDKSDYLEFYEDLINNDIRPKIGAESNVKVSVSTEDTVDGLPF